MGGHILKKIESNILVTAALEQWTTVGENHRLTKKLGRKYLARDAMGNKDFAKLKSICRNL